MQYLRYHRRIPQCGSFVLAILIVCNTRVFAQQSSQDHFQSNDCIGLLGDGLIEQAQYHGWLECMLQTNFPDRSLRFRNIGWSADTPDGKSRLGLSLVQAGREKPDEGWRQLKQQIRSVDASAFIVGYGMASALEEDSYASFENDYRRLLDFLIDEKPTTKLFLLSPLKSIPIDESSDGEVVARLNQRLQNISSIIKAFAKEYQSSFIDLQDVALLSESRDDPIHLNNAGYRELAIAVQDQLGLSNSKWQPTPATPALQQLRASILRKNEWWFHRSRPANMAYVFGFRKHEQGQNAGEIPQFDALIAQEESRIHTLCKLDTNLPSKQEYTTESRFAKFQPQPTPEFTVSDEFEVTLWAENPQLNKPIHMNFDAQGRLWVASSEAYPMIEVGQTAPDKIIVLEDTNQDGTADQSTVFAEGLLIPTGVAPGDGGVYVAQSTDLLFLSDRDGDGQADETRRILSGFGTEDTHHNLHTLRFGPDGRLHMNQSVYTRSDLETVHGVTRLRGGGGMRYDTRNEKIDVFFRGLWNAWGHQFDRFGQSFLTDGAGFDGLAFAPYGAAFNPTPGARRQLELISPGKYPKFASLEIIEGDSFPPDWQGSAITCDFRANRVTRFELIEQGSGFVSQQKPDLLRSSATSFRPIDVKQGPDGALYIADWSNPIINHGEVDFRDERRDRWHGRIWRVAWKKAKRKQIDDFAKKSTSELIDLLTSSDRYDRDTARKCLAERDADICQAILDSANNATSDHHRLEMLWVLQSHNRLQPELVADLLAANDGRIRAATIRAVVQDSRNTTTLSQNSKAELFSILEKSIHDPHPRVRLEAVRGLSIFNSESAVRAALQTLSYPMDPFLDYGLWLTVNECQQAAVDAVLKSQPVDSASQRSPEIEATRVEFVLAALPSDRAAELLSQQLESRGLAADGEGPWIELIAKSGSLAEVQQLVALLDPSNVQPNVLTRAITAIESAIRQRSLEPTIPESRLSQLVESTSQDVQLAAIELCQTMRASRLLPALNRLANSETTPTTVRAKAIKSIATMDGAQFELIAPLFSATQPFPIRAAVFDAAIRSNSNQAFPYLQSILEEDLPPNQYEQLWSIALRSVNMKSGFLERLQLDTIDQATAAIGLQVFRRLGIKDDALETALAIQSGQSMESQERTPSQIADLAKDALANGDPNRGEMIYRRPVLACATCHAIGGVGGLVGPDMSSLGASAPADYIVESIYNPNAKIKEGYHAVSVVTIDGEVFSGIELEGDGDTLNLRDSENRVTQVPKEDIDDKQPRGSLMPAAVVSSLNRQEQLDLIRFLTELGKPGDFDASNGGVARSFRILAGTHRLEQQGADRIVQGEITDGWQIASTRVNGSLDRSTIVELTKQPINIALVHVYLEAEFELAQQEVVSFEVTGPKQFACWIDGQPLEANGAFLQTPLTAGRHRVLIRLDAFEEFDAIRLSSPNATFLSEW